MFVNAHVPRSWQNAVNDRINSGIARWPNAFLADWKLLAEGQGDWFAADGFHVDHAGGVAYADMISTTILATGA